jgi:hypothetical protein
MQAMKILDAASLQVGDDAQPKIGAFTAIPDPMPQNIPVAFHVHAQDRIHGYRFDLALPPEFDMDRIQVDDGVDSGQRAALPLFHQSPDLVGDRTQSRGRNLHAIQVLQRSLNIPHRHAFCVHPNDLFLQLIGVGNLLFHHLRLKLTLAIPWHLDRRFSGGCA